VYPLLGEIIAEVKRDPYVGIAESDLHDFDFVW
jgi:hypothetical protein